MGRCDFLNHSIIAHRGIYNNITIYENSMDAIIYAVKNNIIVEIDIRMTKDNHLIVFHDEDASRLLKIKDTINVLTKEEIDYYSHYKIPTLKEVLEFINGRVPIVIEVKEDNKIFREEVIKILKDYKGKYVIQSFIYDAVKFYHKKDFVTGLLVGKKENINLLNKNLNVDFLNIKYDLLDRKQINILKKKYYLIGYTLDNRSDVEYYIKVYNNLVIDNMEEVFK